MKKLVALLLLSAFMVPLASNDVSARDYERANYHRRGNEYHTPQPRHAPQRHYAPQPRGYWHTGWHNGHHGRWWVTGNNWVYYPAPVPVYYQPRPAPVVVTHQAPVSALWFGFNF